MVQAHRHESTGYSAHRGYSGFSLIELAVTLVIVSIIAVLSTPNFVEWISNARTRASAEAIATGIRQAQVEAISRNVRVELVFTDDAPITDTVAPVASGRNWVLRTAAPASSFIEGKNAAEGGAGVTSLASQALIPFNGLGRIATGAANISVNVTPPNGGTRPLRIVVSLGGGVRICDPALPNTDVRAC